MGSPAPRITATTKVVAILGDPVEHSRSPLMHNRAFSALGIDCVYVAFHVRPAELRKAVAGARALGLAGLNVTVPHKQKIVPFLDDLTPRARAIGAVNTVYTSGERWIGENTDAPGFLRAVRDAGFRKSKAKVLLFGAGGSARAVVAALGEAEVAEITIANRNVARARSLAKFACEQGIATARSIPFESAEEAAGSADLIVNSTSVGLDGTSRLPLEAAATPGHCVFYDLVYAETDTPFVAAARAAGRRCADGREMLLHQAALAFRLWTGRKPRLEDLSPFP